MKTISLSETKMKLSALLKAVAKTRDEIHITINGKVAGVIVHPDELESIKETRAVLGDKDLMSQIKKSQKEIKNGKAKRIAIKDLDEFLEMGR